MLSAECQAMKLEPLKGDPNSFTMYTGVSWKPLEEVIYDDSMVLSFKNPEDPSIAAITVKEDIKMEKTSVDNMQSFKMRPIPKDVEYRMDY
jgi:hypothetical protein